MLRWILAIAAATTVTSKMTATISNAEPGLDVDGEVVDCHDGPIVGPINGTFFLYGEWYGLQNFDVSGNAGLPKLSVYTSNNLTSGSCKDDALFITRTHARTHARTRTRTHAPDLILYYGKRNDENRPY